MKFNVKYLIGITIILYILFTINLISKDRIKYMSISELLEYNIKLFLINNAGLINLNKSGSKLLDIFTNDSLLIKMHRKLNKRYGQIVLTHIITKSENYYILDPKLARQILQDSPHLFSAGKIKEDFFNSFMPKNLGISKCTIGNSCPWKKRRDFNENVLGTKFVTPFYSCIIDIINQNVSKPLLNIEDFRKISLKLASGIIFGLNKENTKLLEQFTKIVYSGVNVLETNFYKRYKFQLHKHYRTAPTCSLLYYANLYRNDTLDIIDDQIPHWFAPFILMVNFLIPTLLCIIINFKDIHSKIKKEITQKGFNLFSNTTYLHYCVIEHIRLFNTININIQRTVNKDMTYHNIKFKKGNQIFILFSSILRDEIEFHKPDQFIPERWENKTIAMQDVVFSVGPQQCPSKRISPIFYKAIIYRLLKNYNYIDVTPKLKSREMYFINPYNIKFSVL